MYEFSFMHNSDCTSSEEVAMYETAQYIHYSKLSDWQHDYTVVVQIHDRETASVRSHFSNRVSETQPVEEALDEAHRFLANDPNIKKIGVILDEGAEWWPAWGERCGQMGVNDDGTR